MGPTIKLFQNEFYIIKVNKMNAGKYNIHKIAAKMKKKTWNCKRRTQFNYKLEYDVLLYYPN